MRARLRRFIPCLAVLVAPGLQAAGINYQATNIAGTTWRYDYTVFNDGAVVAEIRLFDILFDPASYAEASLQVASDAGLSGDWDQLILASGVGVPAAFDVMARGGGIGIGESVSGFAVSFTWLGNGSPGAQDIEIYDAATFQLLGRAVTSQVPGPPALWLLATGLLAAALPSARRTRSRPHRTAAPASPGDS